MKTKIRIIAVFLMLCTGTWITAQKAAAQGGYVSYQVFYDDLSPYGSWVSYSDYGYVWVPDVAPGFIPYATNGYWVYTDYGWTWVSDYPWGWAPFHYGRWYTDATYGPIWIPGNEWGPGWVTWRRSEGYYGWAPMGPGATFNVPYNQWTFVRNGDFGRTNITNYYINNSNNVTIINNSTVINNTRTDKTRHITYNAGPARAEVEKHAGKTFSPVAIKENSKPGQNLRDNQLQLYRPQVKKNIAIGQKSSPSKVLSMKQVKPSAQRTSGIPQQKANQSTKQQPAQTQPAGQQNRQKPAQTKPAGQQNRQKPAQTQPAGQQTKQQPAQTHPSGQSTKQQPAQTHPAGQSTKQQPTQKQQTKPTQNNGGGQHQQQTKPAQNKGGDKQPH